MRLPSDITQVGPVPELVMEVPEEEWTSPPGKRAVSRRGTDSPTRNERVNPHAESPAKKPRPANNTVRNTHEQEERLAV